MKPIRFRHLIFAALLSLALVQPAASQEKFTPHRDAFEEFVVQQMEVDRIPGLTIGFFKDGTTWVKGFGYADLENKSPATAESAYRLASVTKPMTAAAVLQLAEQGKLHPDSTVQHYVPYFPEKKWRVTVRHLLGHLSGISHYRNYDEEGHFKTHYDTEQSLAVFKDWELLFEPGSRYQYTSYGYNLLGAVIEGASGKSYGEYMRENIWLPLGMENTWLDDPVDLIPNRVRGYRIINGEVRNSEFVDISSRFAAGGTRSTVPDMLKFAEGMMSGKILSGRSLNEMYASMVTSDGRYTGYGMGWGINPVNGRFCVRHSGGQAETSTYLFLFPADNFAIAIATNLEGADRNPYIYRLYQLVLNEIWDINAYTGNRAEDVVYTSMYRTFDYGISLFEKNGEPLTTDDNKLAEAFAYFNSIMTSKNLKENFEEVQRKIRDGIHPSAGEPLIRMGSFMAMQLAEQHGSERLAEYHKSGPIPFFHDYVTLYDQTADHPHELRFSEEIEMRILRMAEEWKKTWTTEVQELAIQPLWELSELARLKKVFAAASIYPDFTTRFFEFQLQNMMNDRKENAFATGKLSVELYPKSSDAHVNLALAHLWFGESDRGESLIRQAHQFDHSGATGAGNLNWWAYALRARDKLQAGLDLLFIAKELHPEVANLYDSIGEFYLEKGDKQTSIEYYNKALQIDPDFENAKQMLEKIKQM